MLVFDPRDYGANPNDDIDDTFAIQAALDAARDAGGGHVLLSAGTYILTGTGKASDGALRVYDNTELSGAGMGETILKLQDGWESKITGLIRTPVNQATENVIIRDLTLDGNRDNTTADVDGIMTGVLPGDTERHDNNILIERVEIHDVSRIAFNPHEQTHNLTIRDSVAHHNSWDGFIADWVENGVYENNIAYENGRHGFNVVTHSNNMVLKNNVAYENGENGIVLQRGSGSTTIDGWESAEMQNHDILVLNNEVYNNGKNGILLKQVRDNQIVGNIIYGNGDDGIQIEGAFGNIIDGNTIDSLTHGIEVRKYTGSIDGPDTSYDNIIINNVITAARDAITENHETTVNNTYANNDVGDSAVNVGSSAEILADASALLYELLEIIATLPDNYVGDNPNSADDSEEPPTVVEEPVVEVSQDPPAEDPIVEDPVVEMPVVEDPPPPPVVDEDMVLSGTKQDDTLEGGSGDDKLKGRKGDDTLYGGAGDDYLEGNGGDDILYGGLGADLMKGSGGQDTYAWMSLDEGGDRIKDFRSNELLDLSAALSHMGRLDAETALTNGILRLAQNGKHVDLYVNDGSGETLLVTLLKTDLEDISAENFILPEGGEIVTPDPVIEDEPVQNDPVVEEPIVEELPTIEVPDVVVSEPLELSGGDGDDILVGGNADDTLKGRRGDDVLIGKDGDDSLWGNDGNDILYGGLGSDTMKGGDGADIFMLDGQSTDVDIVKDFRSNDTLSISNILSFDNMHDSITDFIKLSESNGDTIISVDVDGAANGENFVQIATLNNVTDIGSAQDLYASGDLIVSNSDFV